MKRSTGALVVVLVAAVPRLLVLARERGTILEEFVDKSDRFATTLVDHGTFGFLAGVPSAYTQPLYGWFLAGIYLPFGRSWLAVGIAQIVVAVATALVVFAIGTRLQSTGVGLVAAIVTTLHPYVVWHDVHLNREVLDGLALALLALCALAAYERRSLPWAAATGVVAGLAILGNARLILLPVAIAVYVAWRSPLSHAVTAAALVIGMAALVVTPWVIRNKVQVGCYAITTDSRALWKANNENTREVLDRGGWIDDVPKLPGAPPWPELAADLTLSGTPTSVDECAQMRLYRDEVVDFWRDHPGEKARLAVQATRMLWSPVPRESDESGSGTARLARKTIEPAFVIGALRPRDRRLLRRAAALRGAGGADARVQHARGDGLRRVGALPGAVGLPPRPPRRLRARLGLGACAEAAASALRRRGQKRANVERLHPLDAALGRELLEGTLAACFPHRRGAREIPCERDDRLGERLGVRGRDDEPRLPVGDDLGKPAHGARDDRPRALHGLERDHAEPLAERGHDDDRRVLDRGLHGRHEAEEADGVLHPDLTRVRLQRRRERTASRDVEA